MLKETRKKFPQKHIYNAFETIAGSAICLAAYVLKNNMKNLDKLDPNTFYQIQISMYFLGIILNRQDYEPIAVDNSDLASGEKREILKQAIIDLAEELKKEP